MIKALLVLLLWSGVFCVEDQFSKQVESLVRRVRMPEARISTVPGLLQIMEDILNKRWPGCEINLLGSVAYGLAMAFSDLDCSVSLPGYNSTSFENLRTELDNVKVLLQQHSDFRNFYTWTNLTVPVLTFDHEPTRFDVDVSLNTNNERQRSLLVKYMTLLDKRAYYLAFIAKFWSRFSNTTGEYLLRNHGMILLVIFYLQQKNVLPSIASLQRNATPYMIDEWNFGFDEKSYVTQNTDSLRTIIGGFFTYYEEFDFNNYIISPYAGYPIQKFVFQSLDTVPPEFALYKENVMSKKSHPLHVQEGLLLQDLFVHNEGINNTLDTRSDAPFMLVLKDAARRFREDEIQFLKDLQRGKSIVRRARKAMRKALHFTLSSYD